MIKISFVISGKEVCQLCFAEEFYNKHKAMCAIEVGRLKKYLKADKVIKLE